jgi:hypothetical protein
MRSYRGGWVDVMADVARISVKKQSVEDCLHHVVVEVGLACWAEAWREMLLYVVCWVNSTQKASLSQLSADKWPPTPYIMGSVMSV